ncbi:MAG: hypothetical protein ACR2NN_24955 [Bryobacteraceae bacterium]
MMTRIFLFFAAAALALAQQPVIPAGADHELILGLLARVKALEAEITELKGRNDSGLKQEIKPTVMPPQPEAASKVAELPTEKPPLSPMDAMLEQEGTGGPGLHFRGFADVDYRATDRRGDKNTFSLGEFNLFMTSKLSDRLSVLAEMVVAAHQTNEFTIDMERILLEYSANDYFNLSFGRYHSAIGYYNTAYHHSAWLQTTTGRPFLFAFEEAGGILPLHNVGFSATGRIPSGPLGLHYVAEAGNGRASRSRLDEAVQNVQDENNGKSFNLAVFARPDRVRGLQTGFSIYKDRLTPFGLPKISQTILAGYAVYQTPAFEFLNEAVVVRNDVFGRARVVQSPGFYSQLSREFGKVRPYFRYQYLNVPKSDPIFGDVGLVYGPSAGIRYDFSEFLAFKLQYDRTDLGRHQSSFNGLATQLSFTF